ncbi:MAG: cobalamin-binding protein [Dehalococcoidia bacterium]|nr:MAG: cobalamin-binding protein [Dehalococcoidia bacterium]
MDLDAMRLAVVDGDRDQLTRAVTDALAAGAEPAQLLGQALIPGMDEVGELFASNDYFLPEVLLSARAVQGALDVLRPRLAESGIEPAGTVVLGTVQGDLHDIGKNLIGMMLEGAGFRVVDLGSNVAPERFLAAAREHGAAFVALSALLTTTMPAMQATVATLRASDLGDLKLVVGGAPVTEAFARSIGADGYAPDASSAVALVRSLVA